MIRRWGTALAVMYIARRLRRRREVLDREERLRALAQLLVFELRYGGNDA